MDDSTLEPEQTADPSAAPAPEGTAEGVGPEQLEQRLRDAEALAAANLDGWQRTQAEFQNYRRRMERDSEATYAALKADIIREVLPILDDLDLALKNRPSDSGPWVSGVELIHRKLGSILEAQGVRRIQAEGLRFDPTLHEAISHEDAEGVESGHIIAVTQNGYLIGERVIRPARVRVAK